ncbi:hypothetical protein M8J75_010606 [Diaphorina citri]|nr:hypothetical protein M8J75_010606 [Diaphorina citri]
MRSERNDNNNISDYLNMCHKVLVGKEDFNDKKLWESPQNIGPLTPGGSEKHHSRHNMVCCLICNMERRQKRRAQPHPDEPCTSSRFIIKWKSSENPHFGHSWGKARNYLSSEWTLLATHSLFATVESTAYIGDLYDYDWLRKVLGITTTFVTMWDHGISHTTASEESQESSDEDRLFSSSREKTGIAEKKDRNRTDERTTNLEMGRNKRTELFGDSGFTLGGERDVPAIGSTADIDEQVRIEGGGRPTEKEMYVVEGGSCGDDSEDCILELGRDRLKRHVFRAFQAAPCRNRILHDVHKREPGRDDNQTNIQNISRTQYRGTLFIVAEHDDHWHVLHDCTFTSSQCRCARTETLARCFGPRIKRRTLRALEFTTDHCVNTILYLGTGRRQIS